AVDRGRDRAGPAPGLDPALRPGRGGAPRAVPLRRHRAALLRSSPRRRRGGRGPPGGQSPAHHRDPGRRSARLRSRLSTRRAPRLRLGVPAPRGDLGGSRVPDLRRPAHGARGAGRRIEPPRVRLMRSRSGGEAALVAALLTLLAALIVYPLLQVLSVAFLDGGWPTLRPLLAFFARPVFREAL